MTLQYIKQAFKKLQPTEYNLFVHPNVVNQIPKLPDNVHLVIETYVPEDKAYLCEIKDLEDIIEFKKYE